MLSLIHILKYLFLLSMGAFIFTGCNNLDQMPYDKHTDETYWQSAENSELLVNMAYNQMYNSEKMWTCLLYTSTNGSL